MNKLILLAHFPKMTVHRYRGLRNAFPNVEESWQAQAGDFKNSGWEDDLVGEFLRWRDKLDIEKTQKILDQEQIHCVTMADPEYPPLLKEIYDPPFCLFVRGDLDNLAFPLAVVGPRKHSQYGEQVTREIVASLAARGICIVSGLALGIDGLAHQTALQAGGRTVAVLGCGNDKYHIQPAAHRLLANQIIEAGGAVITEYPPGTVPNTFTFPRRNRIIAGLTLGTLVIEASESSGSLITAQCALDNGREVFAVPQNITSETATGANNLLKMGARLVTSHQDILDALNLHDIKQYVTSRDIVPDSPAEAALISYLSREPVHIDQLIKQSTLDSPTVNSTLTLMEMKGRARNIGGMMYVLAR